MRTPKFTATATPREPSSSSKHTCILIHTHSHAHTQADTGTWSPRTYTHAPRCRNWTQTDPGDPFLSWTVEGSSQEAAEVKSSPLVCPETSLPHRAAGSRWEGLPCQSCQSSQITDANNANPQILPPTLPRSTLRRKEREEEARLDKGPLVAESVLWRRALVCSGAQGPWEWPQSNKPPGSLQRSTEEGA